MSALQPFCHLIGINSQKLLKEESIFLEAELFIRICGELMEIIKEQNKDYFHLIKLNIEKESSMIEENFIRCVINDILSTEEYDLTGLAYYTNIPEDVIHEVAIGRNTSPTLLLSRKIIELHRNVRPSLYAEVMNKIINEHLTLPV